MPAGTRRRKLSTTVSPETHSYLEFLVKSGKVGSIAEAVDLAVERARRSQSRARLERDTAAYFQGLSARAAAEEARLESALGQMAEEIDLDA